MQQLKLELAVCGINTSATKVVNDKGEPAFGPQRPVAGVSGERIRSYALAFVAQARKIIDKAGLNLVLFGTGGIMKPEHFTLFLEAGADAALSATGTMWNPDLANNYHARVAPR